MHVLASSCVFFRADKTGLHLSWSSAVNYRPGNRQVSQEHITLSVGSLSLLAWMPTPLVFVFFNCPVHPQTGFICHIRSLATLFFQACKRVVVYFPSASLSPSWKSGKTSSVCLAQSRFFPPTRSHSPYNHLFFLLVLPPKQGRSSPEAEHFNNSRCKVVFPVLKRYSH